jgi:hypothetical protein
LPNSGACVNRAHGLNKGAMRLGGSYARILHGENRNPRAVIIGR